MINNTTRCIHWPSFFANENRIFNKFEFMIKLTKQTYNRKIVRTGHWIIDIINTIG